MGQELSNMCSCFDKIQESKQEMSFNSPQDKSHVHEEIVVSDEIQGFDYAAVSKKVSNAVENFTQLICEGVTGYDVIFDKENCKVYSKEASEGYVLKYTWNVPYSPKEFMEFMDIVDLRKTWDSNIDNIKVIGFYNPKESIMYTRYKKFITFDPRETLAYNKSTHVNGNLAEITFSVQSDLYPVSDGAVRVNLYVAGLYAEHIEPDEFGNKTKVTCLSHMDVGLPKALNNVARKFAGTTIPPLTKKISTQLRKYYEESKI